MKKEIRVFGKAGDEIKEEEIKKIQRFYFEHIKNVFKLFTPEQIEKITALEYQKSPKEIRIINIANQLTSNLMKECGVEPYDIPVENVHILPPELYKDITKLSFIACSELSKGALLFNALEFRNNPLFFCSVLTHELLHLKAYLSIEVNEEVNESDVSDKNKVIVTPRRQGVSVHSTKKIGPQPYFDGLHEAIVAETQKRLLPKILELEDFKEEREWLNSDDAKRIKKEDTKKYAKKNNIPEEDIPELEEDIIWISKLDHKVYRNSYFYQRKVLKYICEEIQKQFPDEFKNPDDVFKLFLKAHFTGNILEIGRRVAKTFGKLSLQALGMMGTDDGSARKCLRYLKTARSEILKSARKENKDEQK
jgi:hypothetical protein